jgi:hypothetical protein
VKVADLGNSLGLTTLNAPFRINHNWTSPEAMDLFFLRSSALVLSKTLKISDFLMKHDVYTFGLVVCYMLTAVAPFGTKLGQRIGKHSQFAQRGGEAGSLLVSGNLRFDLYVCFTPYLHSFFTLTLSVRSRLLPSEYRALLENHEKPLHKLIRHCLTDLETRWSFDDITAFIAGFGESGFSGAEAPHS